MARLALIVAGIGLAVSVLFATPGRAGSSGDVATLNGQVRDLIYAKRQSEALPLAKQALDAAERQFGPDHAEVGYSLHNLALILEALGAGQEAMPLYERALPLRERDLGANDIEVGQILNNLGNLYQGQGRFAEAEPLYQRMLKIFEATLGPDHAAVATGLNNLAELYKEQGRYGDAEPLLKASLEKREKTLGLDHLDVGNSLNNLAALYILLGRAPEAEPLYRRSLAITEKAVGTGHEKVAVVLNNLAFLLKGLQRYPEAEPLYKRALAIRETALGPDHPDTGATLNNLAELYRAEGRNAEAEPLLKRDLAIGEKALGSGSIGVAATRNNLGELYRTLGRFAGAEALYQQALATFETVLSPDHPNTSLLLDNLAGLTFEQGKWAEATEYWLQSTDIIVRRFQRNAVTAGHASAAGAGREIEGYSFRFKNLVRAANRLGEDEPQARDGLAQAMFQTAQWAQSSKAAQSLAKMAARSASGNAALSRLVRERQDLSDEWQSADSQLITARSNSPGARDPKNEGELAARLRSIDRRLSEIDTRLAADFPNYAALTNPEPLSISDVQEALRPGEALVLFLDTPEMKPVAESTFIWAVTKTQSRWVRSNLGSKALSDRVGALRCGLDEAAWSGDGAQRCSGLLGLDPAQMWRRGKPLPFDMTTARNLYNGLFDGIGDLITDKHLLLVPSGALTSLPFQVLVTDEARGTSQGTPWLIRGHAITVLPSVASLAALRTNAKASSAPEPFIGYGNPLLAGSALCGKATIPTSCPDENLPPTDADGESAPRSLDDAGEASAYFRNGLADVAAIRTRLCPLPDTEHELTCVARSLGAAPASVVLAANMTETALKHATLDRYRILHFATHGLLAGETAQLSAANAEPALVMSPPSVPSAEDDGLLTASEVAGLKLDADWVVMSACNTAAASATGAEALSGLARAFFYAGSRALLVSHWPVNSYAATMLTSHTFAELKSDPSIGRSEALRRAMLALMSDPKRPWAARPSVWAPFVVVGEGGAAAVP